THRFVIYAILNNIISTTSEQTHPDVVFDVELIPYLVKTLHLLLSNSGDNHEKPSLYSEDDKGGLLIPTWIIEHLHYGQQKLMLSGKSPSTFTGQRNV
ncbi:hypothetical protein P5673_002993, partial [Acropora cervicornis]